MFKIGSKFFSLQWHFKTSYTVFLGINRTSLDGSKKVPPYVYYCIGNHAIHSDEEIPEMNNKQLCAFTTIFFFSDSTHAYIILSYISIYRRTKNVTQSMNVINK